MFIRYLTEVKPIACGPPPSILNAIIRDPIAPKRSSILASGFDMSVVMSEEISATEQTYPILTKIPIECVPGFQLIGEPVIQCMTSGKWSRLPKCIGTACFLFIITPLSLLSNIFALKQVADRLLS